MRQFALWMMMAALGACSSDPVATDPGGDTGPSDTGPGDIEQVDWQPSGKDATVFDGTDATVADEAVLDALDAAPDAGTDALVVPDAADVADAATAVFSADIGGGLPSEITAITKATSLFDPDGIHEVKITLKPADWTAYMNEVNQPDGLKNYNWYQADLWMDGFVYKNVGIHGFGNGSQLDNPSKPNVRVKFDEIVSGATGPEGEKAFRLKASGQDPTYVREPLAGAMLRAIGGTAPRFSWAHVTVNGEDFGPYIVQETVDKRLFHNAFGNNDGPKIETVYGCYGIDCPASGCGALKDAYTANPGDPQLVVDVAQAITDATNDQLSAVLDQYFYTDELLADYAVDAVLSNLDGFAAAGQNFTIYADEKTTKFHLIATGVDLTFGNMKDAWYDLFAPWGAPNSWCPERTDQLYQRIWQTPALQAKLFAKFQALQCGLFKDTTLLPLIASYHKALKPYIDNEPKGIYTPSQVDDYYVALAQYVAKRQKTLGDLLGSCK
jgi:hypothetical protein